MPDGDDFEPFEALVFGHLEPCIELLSARSRVTARVLWNSAANLFEAVLNRIEMAYGARASVMSARRVVASERWSDGRDNPLFHAVSYRHEGDRLVRRRRVCCMRYRVPDRVFCQNCPSPLRRAAGAAGPD